MDLVFIPPVTTYALISMVVTSALATYFISPYYFIFSPKLIFTKLHIWRLGTGFLFTGGFRPGFVFTLLLAYFAVSQIEMSLIEKKGDFYYLLLVLCTISGVLASYSL